MYHLDEETIMVFIDVSSVPKLHKQSISTEIRLGGNVTLTQTIEIMNSVDTTPGFEYCSYIAEHINRVANVPVRNVGHLCRNCIANSEPVLKEGFRKNFRNKIFKVSTLTG